jgi:hypothetical protein
VRPRTANLLNSFGPAQGAIEYVIDRSVQKVEQVHARVKLPIRPVEQATRDQPDRVLILD